MSASRSTLSASPAQVAADGAGIATITARALDVDGAPLPGKTAVFHVGGSSNAVSPASAVTGADGVATAALTSTHAEAKVVAVTIDGVAVTQQASVAFVAGPAASLQVLAAASATAGDALQVSVTARDANGNLATGFAGTVALSASDGAAVLPAAAALPGASGSSR